MFEFFLENTPEFQTVEDDKVENSFWLAAEQSGIKTSADNINYMRGWPVQLVFETLCNKLLPYAKANEIQKMADESYSIFIKDFQVKPSGFSKP